MKLDLSVFQKAFISLFFFASAQAIASTIPAVVLVDKKTNTLKIAKYNDNKYEVIKSYHTTVGQVIGDKEEEDDLKTPEGIYTFTARFTPPTIKPIFGKLAFYMNYPNPFDRIAGHSGYDIMVHATDQPSRLNKNFDSKGCIVVNNEQITEIENYIRIGLTPVLVFDEFTDNYMYPSGDTRLTNFFKNWMKAWESKDIETYISSYHSAFESGGKRLNEWKKYKDRLNKIYHRIQVAPTKITYLRHPKYSVIKFVQNYQSFMKNGKAGHLSRGTKTLYIAEEFGNLKIISEDFTPRIW